MIDRDLLIGLATGFISSIVVLFLDRRLRARKLKHLFAPIAGKYAQFDIDGNPKDDWITVFEFKGENVLSTHAKSPEFEWHGTIVMSEYMPGFGTGSYQYVDRPDCGLHQIQVDQKHEVIFVHWLNTSHGKSNEGSFVLRRVN